MSYTTTEITQSLLPEEIKYIRPNGYVKKDGSYDIVYHIGKNIEISTNKIIRYLSQGLSSDPHSLLRTPFFKYRNSHKNNNKKVIWKNTAGGNTIPIAIINEDGFIEAFRNIKTNDIVLETNDDIIDSFACDDFYYISYLSNNNKMPIDILEFGKIGMNVFSDKFYMLSELKISDNDTLSIKRPITDEQGALQGLLMIKYTNSIQRKQKSIPFIIKFSIPIELPETIINSSFIDSTTASLVPSKFGGERNAKIYIGKKEKHILTLYNINREINKRIDSPKILFLKTDDYSFE